MLTLPNLLTLSRIAAVPLLGWLLFEATPAGAVAGFVLYALIAVTDWFDGYLARRMKTVSKLGTFLDPIADKVMVAAVLFLLAAPTPTSAEPPIAGLHLIPAVAILLREIAVSGLREFLGPLGVAVPVSKLAKWKTTAQMVALGALILGQALPALHAPGLALLWIAAGLTLATGWSYLRVGLAHMD